MSELDYATSTELVNEVTNRATFVGIILHSTKENKGDVDLHSKWEITYAKLTEQQAYEILKDATEHFRQLALSNDDQ